MFYVFCNWCFGEIDTVFIVMQINIDGLTHSISKGNKKKMCKKTKIKKSLLRKKTKKVPMYHHKMENIMMIFQI
jgi:uncharacterized protein (UPF0212 family)